MGIYDRDYYRSEKTNLLDWLLPESPVCKWLFAAYIIVAVLQLLTLGDRGAEDAPAMLMGGHVRYGGVTDMGALVPDLVMHGQVWRLVSYAFLHVPHAFLSFVFGMWFLWAFAPDLEQLYGSRRFAVFYFGTILAASITYTIVSVARGEQGGYHLWSSEALAAVLILCAIHFPNRVILILFIIPVPIWILAALYVLWNIYQALAGGLGTQAIVLSQIATIGYTVGFYKYQHEWDWKFPDVFALFRWRPRGGSKLRLYRPDPEQTREPVSVAAPPAGHAVDEHFEAKLDAVLEKIARTGKESLTADEQQILVRASELYKKRRS